MEKMRFEEALRKLEELVEKLESGDLDLEDSITAFQEGMELTRYCQQQLKQAEGKIQRLILSLDGTVDLEDIEEFK